MKKWLEIPFEQAFKDVTSKGHKVDQNQFQESGDYPIVDQGQQFVAAYTNDQNLVWKHELPVIIFGDHTRALKYVDFPFVLGADGTKVLRPIQKLYPKYAYYVLRNIEIPSAGYSRHFKFLKEHTIPLPPLDEQRRIAGTLSRADRLRRLRRTALTLSDGYLQSVFLQMFGDPVSNPMGWEVKTLAQLKTKFAYGTNEKSDYEPVGLPVLRIPNILSKKIDLTDLKYSEVPEKEVKKLRLEAGDLIFVRTNGNPDYVGRCAVFDLSGDYLYASYLIRARVDKSKISSLYLDEYLRTDSGRRAMSPYIRTTAGQSNIGMEGLGQIPVPLPPLALQQKFGGIVRQVERLRSQQREAARQAEALFQALLHQAFQ